ncbi:MAG: DUF4271 domain-containing protein [Prevotellaceae bacterium]|jgi:hypothetical protein|nr:DUF4271 domain-containing protein [Prevotellaceae bacterium]
MTHLFAAAIGIEGIPIPYSPRLDDGILLLLLFCFLLSAYALARSQRLLVQLAKNFLLNRERISIFANFTSADMRYQVVLILQTCLLCGLCLFLYFIRARPALIADAPPYRLLFFYVAACATYLLMKWLVYTLLGWIFFDKAKIAHWMESYSTLLYYLGLVLFPLALMLIYFNLPLQTAAIIGLSVLILMKILIFYKWLKLFCQSWYGCLLLIVYFCALEMIPYLMIYQGLLQLNDYLILK